MPLKRFFLGPPIRKSEMNAEKLPKKTAFAVFASDALSSIAYAPGELMYQFVLAGVAITSLTFLLPLAGAISLTVIAVIILYRLVITHYPHGGGTYTVAKDHLGETASLIAAAALLIDYILTVSVSVVSGVAQIGAIFPPVDNYRAIIAIVVVVFIAFINLRGYRESGNFFAIPLYAFLSTFSLLLLAGLFAWVRGVLPHVESSAVTLAVPLLGSLGIFVTLRAFASGSTALTGIEAISNGVPVFKEPSPKNARTTLALLGGVIVAFLMGAALLTKAIGLVPQNPEVLIPTLGSLIFPVVLPALFAKIILGTLTIAITVILLIAANTAFVDLPRLSSLLARDGYLPRQFKNRGDRQVFSFGIIMLIVLACIPILVFNARVTPLIPLYGIGVFTTFSLLGWSMVRHALRKTIPGHEDTSGVSRSTSTLIIGLIAGIVTSVVLGVFLVTKFTHGAFVIVIIMPMLVLLMRRIHASYINYEKGLRLEEGRKFQVRRVTNTVIISLGNINRAALKVLNRAQDIEGRKIAVHVVEDDEQEENFRRQWEALGANMELIVLRTEYNSMTAPILDFIKRIKEEEDAKEVHDPLYIHHLYVVLGEIVPLTLWANLLHNQTAFFLYEQLRGIPEVTPILVRYVPNKIPLGEKLWGASQFKFKQVLDKAKNMLVPK